MNRLPLRVSSAAFELTSERCRFLLVELGITQRQLQQKLQHGCSRIEYLYWEQLLRAVQAAQAVVQKALSQKAS
jgi:hypothetical protein